MEITARAIEAWDALSPSCIRSGGRGNDLQEASKVDFAFLKDTLEFTDGNLARHLQVLEEAGYVRVSKDSTGRRPRTWVRITKAGRRAFAAETDALRELLDSLGSPADVRSVRAFE